MGENVSQERPKRENKSEVVRMSDVRDKRAGLKMVIISSLICCLLLQMSVYPVYAGSSTPLQTNGQLKVKGTGIVNSSGKTVTLKGVSLHGINWFPQYINKSAFKTLRDQWGVNCIRLPMYTTEYNGYCSGGNQSDLKKLINNGVKYATELGMYVIIDWHILSDSNPK